jgi:hypothetical protein
MVSNVVQNSKTKFKLPKFQLPLTLQEILIIFASAFSNNIIRIYENNIGFYPMVIISFIFIWWSCDVLKQYTIKEKMTTSGESEKKYLSINFITDLFFHFMGLTLALVFITIFDASLLTNVNLFQLILYSFFIKFVLRLGYYLIY